MQEYLLRHHFWQKLEHDGVCEISDSKHNDSLFVSDFAGFNRKNLALYCNLTDRTVNLFNGHLLIIKASSIHDIRVIVIFTSEISLCARTSFLKFLFKFLFRLFISAGVLFLNCCQSLFLPLFSCLRL